MEEVADDRDAFAPESADSEYAEEAEAEIADALDTAGAHEPVDEQVDELIDREEITTEESLHADEVEAADERSEHGETAEARSVEQAESEGDATPEQADEQQESEEDKPRWERPAHMSRRATRRAREEVSELNDGGATEAATASSVDRSDESPEVAAARAEGLPVLGRDEAGLRTLAQILGQDTPLVARSELGLPTDLVLAASGAVSGAGLTYPSLDTLLTARGLGHLDAWGQVRIGDRLGPTLAEALDEVNREIVREYAQAPRGHRSAKH